MLTKHTWMDDVASNIGLMAAFIMALNLNYSIAIS